MENSFLETNPMPKISPMRSNRAALGDLCGVNCPRSKCGQNNFTYQKMPCRQDSDFLFSSSACCLSLCDFPQWSCYLRTYFWDQLDPECCNYQTNASLEPASPVLTFRPSFYVLRDVFEVASLRNHSKRKFTIFLGKGLKNNLSNPNCSMHEINRSW